jgi:hypothetical protein
MREKKDKDLLRKAFNKWKDIINKKILKQLKSKLLFRIYAKNNSLLDKDLLNKYFQIWKFKTFKNNLDKINSGQSIAKNLFVKSVVNNLDKKTNQIWTRIY